MTVVCHAGYSKPDAHLIEVSSMSISTIAIVCVGVVILLLLTVCFIYNRINGGKSDLFDDMEGSDFEKYCADLLIVMGYEEVELTPQSRDFGVDILAKKDDVSYAFQCKCYADPVGIKAIQEVYAGRDFYECMVGVVITNQEFTGPAKEYADKLNIILWDGNKVSDMISKFMI